MKNGYAPVVVFGYNRSSKIRECLEALNRCHLAEESDLFIFVDGPKQNKDQNDVEQVRQVVRSFVGESVFQSIKITESKENRGLANSVIAGVTQVIKAYGRVIVVEDDLCVNPHFLKYMNSALDYFESDDRIWSISGYTEPLPCLEREKNDVYLGYRACSWGWGTWEDRWKTVQWNLDERNLYDRQFRKKIRFMRGGLDLPKMLKRQLRGEINSWAVRWCYAQSMQDRYCVFPTETLLTNNGFDGSGTNCDDDGIVRSNRLSFKTKFDYQGTRIQKRLTTGFFLYQERQRIRRTLGRLRQRLG